MGNSNVGSETARDNGRANRNGLIAHALALTPLPGIDLSCAQGFDEGKNARARGACRALTTWPSYIPLWLGHESPSTTHMYVEADIAMKERALARLKSPESKSARYRPPKALMQFLQAL